MKLSTIGILIMAVFGTGLLVFSTNTKPNTPTTISKNEPPVLKETNTGVPFNRNKKVYNIDAYEDNTVVLMGEVNELSARIAVEITEKANNPANHEVFLVIDSPGGSVLDGALIINAIEAARTPVHTVCIGLCASMGAIIHQYGKSRLMVDRAMLMFHDAAGGFRGYFPHIKSRFQTIERYIKRFDSYIATRVGIPLGQLELAQHKELWIDSEDALAQNYADKIVYINFKKKFKWLGGSDKKETTPTANTETTKNKFFDLKW